MRTPADLYTVKAVKAVIDNQEPDSRTSTGAMYWEGRSDLFGSNGKHGGHWPNSLTLTALKNPKLMMRQVLNRLTAEADL